MTDPELMSASAHDDIDQDVETTNLIELRPEHDQKGERLDRFVAVALPEISRTRVQELIEQDRVLVDGVARKAKFKVTPGQVVTVDIPPVVDEEILPEAIPLDIVFEDDDVIVINKPAGLVVHPAPGHPTGTLVNAVLHHVPGIAVGGSNRPGIIHRLDKDTSGLIAVVKTDRGRAALVPQWETRTVEKTYITMVIGAIGPDEGTIDAPIGRDPKNRQRMAVIKNGRPALSHFTVLERFRDVTLLEVRIETGRTHQIRVHLAFIGHPVLGDATYGGDRAVDGISCPRQFLHAAGLALDLPSGERIDLSTPLPDDLQIVLDAFRLMG